MAIGPLVINAISASLKELMGENVVSMDKAYLNADGPLDITLKAKIKPTKFGSEVNTSISFVAEKITGSATFDISEDQMDLFEEEE